jgi:ssDNA-binding Zn-finger/Zn-ribbon topoisomerase 1
MATMELNNGLTDEKVVLLCRVSSSKQDLASQISDVKRFVTQQGYNEDQMIILSNKESASKSFLLKGLQDLKNAVENNNVKCIYAWTLSRLSRIERVLNDIKYFCIDNKINLKLRHEGFTLLNIDTLEPNRNAIREYDNYKNFVVEDTAMRRESSMRGIKEAAENNQYLGGSIFLGYKVVNKKFEVDPDTSKIVQKIFQMYETGLESFTTIQSEILKIFLKKMDRNQIGDVLNNRFYTGEILRIGKYDRFYPALITVETFEICQKILKQKSGRILDRTKEKNVFYAGRKLKCPHCGETLVAFSTSNQYACKNYHEKRGCPNGITVNLNVVDSIALSSAWKKNFDVSLNQDENEIKKTELKIEELQTKIDNSEKEIEIIRDKQRKRLKELLKSAYSEKLLEQSLIDDITEIKNKTFEFTTEINRLKSHLNDVCEIWIDNQGVKNVRWINYDVPLIEEMTDKERKELVLKYIKDIRVINLDHLTKEITITTFCNDISTFIYYHRAKHDFKRLFEVIHVEGRLFTADPEDREKVIEVGKGIYHKPISYKKNVIKRF